MSSHNQKPTDEQRYAIEDKNNIVKMIKNDPNSKMLNSFKL